MTYEEIQALFAATGLPCTHRAWKVNQAPPLPFLCWIVPYCNNFAADGQVWHSAKHVQLELYTKETEPGTEEQVETVLNDAGIFWTKSQEYLESEEAYMTIYEIEV